MKNLSERIVEVLKDSKRISEEDIQKALVISVDFIWIMKL